MVTLLSSVLPSFTGIAAEHSQLGSFKQRLSFDIVQKLERLVSVPLRGLDRLTEELNGLGKEFVCLTGSFDQDRHEPLRELLYSIHTHLYGALRGYIDSRTLRSLEELLACQANQLHVPGDVELQNEDVNDPVIRAEVQKVIDRYLFPSLCQLSLSTRDSRISARSTAHGCINLFLGYLVLFVPDRPFDPSLVSRIAKSIWKGQRDELDAKLHALQRFEHLATGQSTSLRCQSLERGLQSLGSEPPSCPPRPVDSGFSALHNELANLLHYVVQRCPVVGVDSLALDSHVIEELEMVGQNISRIVPRLSENFLAFSDITKPVVGLAHGLNLGVHLSLMHESSNPSMLAVSSENNLPLLGPNIENVAQVLRTSLNATDRALNFLRRIILEKSITANISDTATDGLMSAVQHLYRAWKQRLESDQAKHLEKTSLYHYEAPQNDESIVSQSELDELFLDYSKGTDTRSDGAGLEKGTPQLLTQHVAQQMMKLFASNLNAKVALSDAIQGFIMPLSAFALGPDEISRFSDEQLCSLTISRLDQVSRCFKSDSPGSYNFYADPNLQMARALLDVLRRVHKRFRALRQQWPEHAILSDVLSAAQVILNLNHSEPVAKWLPRAESLHALVYEWQSVASREFSVADLYHELTEMIVNCRRLELSTWAKLLDLEDDKCQQDGIAWFFVAYQATIAAALDMGEDEAAIRQHAESLVPEMQRFLCSAALGHFPTRLDLLELLSQLCRQFEARSPALSAITNSLKNLARYYGRYESAARESIQKGRDSVEKQIKEVILLASWKDKNVNALRESSRKSQLKLFRLIRKYRALLSEPVQPILAAPFSPERHSGDDFTEIVNFRSFDILTKALPDPHVESIPELSERLGRLKHPLVVAQDFQRMTISAHRLFEPADLVQSFTSSFSSRVHAFAKATPSSLTPENKDKVKQLRSLKRKMFAEVLRKLRTMGFRYNLDTTILERQSEISKILSTVPSTESLYGSEGHFFGFLDQVLAIRADARKHSEELTSNEVSRSVGFMEGLLFNLCNQRQVLKDSLDGLECLDEALDLLRSLSSRDKMVVPRSASGFTDVDRNQHFLAWFSTLSGVSCDVLDKQQSLGGADNSKLRRELDGWSTKAKALKDSLYQQPKAPAGLSTSAQLEIDRSIQITFFDIWNRLDLLKAEHPSASFILNQLRPWLAALQDRTYEPLAWISSYNFEVTYNNVPTLNEGNGSGAGKTNAATDFKSRLFQILDIAIPPIKEYTNSVQKLPSSKEENGWLQKTEDSISKTFKAFFDADIGRRLQMALHSCNVEISEDNTINSMAAICSVSLPVLELYREVYSAIVNRYAKLHQSECRMAFVLSETFGRMLKQGFCTPPENSSEESQAGDLRDGIGLGEGEGANDISKDIQDDEDLADLAEQENVKGDKDEIGDEPDAVDMADNSMEGEVEEGEDLDDASSSSDEQAQENADDEVGSVNSVDQSHRDEQMQEGQQDASKNSEARGQSRGTNQDEVAAIEQPSTRDPQAAQEENNEPEIEEDDSVVEELEPSVDQAKAEDGGAEMQNTENLDLPEDMEIDNRKGSDSEISDEDMEDISSMDTDEAGPEEANDVEQEVSPTNVDREDPEIQRDDIVDRSETAMEDPLEDEDQVKEEDRLEEHSEDVIDITEDDPRRGVGAGESNDQHNEEVYDEEKMGGQKGNGRRMEKSENDSAVGAEGEPKQGHQDPTASRSSATIPQPRGGSPIRRLGNALEKWKRKNQQILDAQEQDDDAQAKSADTIAPDQEYSHLPNEGGNADAQVLGRATEEQTMGLNQEEMAAGIGDEQSTAEALMEDAPDPEVGPADDPTQAAREQHNRQAGGQGALVGQKITESSMPDASSMDLDDDLPDQLSIAYPHSDSTSRRGLDEARQLWVHYERLTRELSMSLAEQLRLILAPTLKSKMRGDFRTGKRLNIKRIIPYIASGYKRDKIWMRRSIASKRNYQVMLAVDDSKSMGESGSGRLAFETLALVSKSLSLLEVGQICVVSFGNETSVAHPFDKPFSSDAGVEIFQRFTFQQTRTDVQKLVSTSLEIFREAKMKQHNSSADLWQLQLVISDGICENHESIQRLVRQAHEDKVMIIFVIIDSMSGNASIVDMTQASFEGEANGEPSLKIQRYLESFPFNYYLIVRDVKELPSVLASALRQWFAEVSEA